ncbi:MAG: c-type cytochrome [Qingshengfaniella sp.]
MRLSHFSGLAGFAALTAVTALSVQAEVTNPTVQERIDAMKTMGLATRSLSQMARGQAPFDADAVAAAKETLVRISTELPDLFRAEETDPESGALPAIWLDYGDFEARAAGMLEAASALDPSAEAGLGQGVAQIGQACSACHQAYKAD